MIINSLRKNAKLKHKKTSQKETNELTKPEAGHSTQFQQALKHNESYTDLLQIYVKTARVNIWIKNICKIVFFIATMGSLLVVLYLFYDALQYVFEGFSNIEDINTVSLEAILSMVTVLVPAIASLIVAFIKIPEIIAQYLFNTEEEKYMHQIIKNIQDYDNAYFDRTQKKEQLLSEQKDNSREATDEKIETSPKEKKQNVI